MLTSKLATFKQRRLDWYEHVCMLFLSFNLIQFNSFRCITVIEHIYRINFTAVSFVISLWGDNRVSIFFLLRSTSNTFMIILLKVTKNIIADVVSVYSRIKRSKILQQQQNYHNINLHSYVRKKNKTTFKYNLHRKFDKLKYEGNTNYRTNCR